MSSFAPTAAAGLFLGAILLFAVSAGEAQAQVQEYEIMDRGMLHETIYNEGSIGRLWTILGIEEATTPLMEWPPNSDVDLEGIEYSGQHNRLGGGVWIGANPKEMLDRSDRTFAFSGAIGLRQSPDPPLGKWSFPISFRRIDNFPVLENGSLNPDYDPNEAEQIVIARWATNTGIEVTRESRAWSHPDYNDFIIHDYLFEFTGNTDSNPTTIEMEDVDELWDVMFHFVDAFAPSMLGYQRWYNSWLFRGGFFRGDQVAAFDNDYWLDFSFNFQTAGIAGVKGGPEMLIAKPEPLPDVFLEWARNGTGGQLSPQFAGTAMIRYDTEHLATVYPDSSINQSYYGLSGELSRAEARYELTEDFKIKQPFVWRGQNGQLNTRKVIDEQDWSWTANRASPVYSDGEDLTSDNYYEGMTEEQARQWVGRAKSPHNNKHAAPARIKGFGPYTVKKGDQLRFVIAEVVGYGGTPGKLVDSAVGENVRNPLPSLNVPVLNQETGDTLTTAYLDEFGYPDYVDSDVATIQDVAHKAFEAYAGRELQAPMWPEDLPSQGSYTVPTPPPAPAIEVLNTADFDVRITWSQSAEEFTHPRLTGGLAKYNVYRSINGIAWEHLGSVDVGDVQPEGEYLFIDADAEFKIGEARFFAVTSVDEHGNESGKTNTVFLEKEAGAVSELDKVYVVPNPFVVDSGFQRKGGGQDQLEFMGLPERCTIEIFSFAGQLVDSFEHDDGTYSESWFQVNRDQQEIASGVYFFVVTTPEGEQSRGKFVVVK